MYTIDLDQDHLLQACRWNPSLNPLKNELQKCKLKEKSQNSALSSFWKILPKMPPRAACGTCAPQISHMGRMLHCLSKSAPLCFSKIAITLYKNIIMTNSLNHKKLELKIYNFIKTSSQKVFYKFRDMIYWSQANCKKAFFNNSNQNLP